MIFVPNLVYINNANVINELFFFVIHQCIFHFLPGYELDGKSSFGEGFIGFWKHADVDSIWVYARLWFLTISLGTPYCSRINNMMWRGSSSFYYKMKNDDLLNQRAPKKPKKLSGCHYIIKVSDTAFHFNFYRSSNTKAMRHLSWH